MRADVDDACVAFLASVRLKENDITPSSLSALQCHGNTKRGMAQMLSAEHGAMNVRGARRTCLCRRAKEPYVVARADAEYDFAVAKTPSPDTEPASDAYAMKKVYIYAKVRRNSSYGRRP